nr:ATP-binding cassette domain-containing protein [Pseudenhygromyxa sp. WMMC2535]
MLSLRGLSVGWGPRCVLPQLQLEVNAGEVLCVVGPGGSGKSTLLRALEAIILDAPPDPQNLWWRGEVDVSVETCRRLNQHGSFARDRISELLAVEELSWLLEASERDVLQTNLDRSLAAVPDHLRRVLSFALVAREPAPLLLFDEPIFSLPEPWSAQITAGLRALASRGKTLIVVTHYLPLAREIGDRVALLIDGALIESGPTEDFFCRARHPRTRRFLQWGT